MTTPPKHGLRWYQYSLRSLFVLTVLVAIAGSWFTVRRQQVERERAAVRWITEMGGRVEYDYQYGASGKMIPNAKPPGPAWLRAWLGDDFFTHVAVLSLRDTRVTDAGLEHIQGLTTLQELDLSYTQITDAGLEHLKRLSKLQRLSLAGTPTTDAGIENLDGLTSLQRLSLFDTKVTDAGLVHLKGLTRLELLSLLGNKVTDDGVNRLQEALPNCQIIR